MREPVEGTNMGKSTFQAIHQNCLMISGQFAWEDAVYITSSEDESGVVSHRYYLLTPKRHDIPVEYLFAHFISPEGFDELVRCSHGAAGRNRPLNIEELLRVKIPAPTDEDSVKRLVDSVRNYMKLQKNIAKKEALLHEYRNKIISDVVTGKINVRDIDIPDYEYIEEETDMEDDSESEDEITEEE